MYFLICHLVQNWARAAYFSNWRHNSRKSTIWLTPNVIRSKITEGGCRNQKFGRIWAAVADGGPDIDPRGTTLPTAPTSRMDARAPHNQALALVDLLFRYSPAHPARASCQPRPTKQMKGANQIGKQSMAPNTNTIATKSGSLGEAEVLGPKKEGLMQWAGRLGWVEGGLCEGASDLAGPTSSRLLLCTTHLSRQRSEPAAAATSVLPLLQTSHLD